MRSPPTLPPPQNLECVHGQSHFVMVTDSRFHGATTFETTFFIRQNDVI